MAAAAPLGCDFVPSLRCAMDSAWGFISGCFLATSMVFVFAAWLVCELHAGLCPLRLRHGFSTSRRIVPTSVGTRFFLSDFLLDSNFGDFSCSTTSCLRWRQRQHFSDFTARLCQHPRLRRKRRLHQTSGTSWSSTSFTFRTSTSHDPLRVQTRGLPANIWLDLRYSSSHFEAICGLRVHFYGKEAARLLGRGREHLNWSHFAGMSYFSVDNVCYTHFKNVDDFLESLRLGRQVSKLLLPETS